MDLQQYSEIIYTSYNNNNQYIYINIYIFRTGIISGRYLWFCTISVTRTRVYFVSFMSTFGTKSSISGSPATTTVLERSTTATTTTAIIACSEITYRWTPSSRRGRFDWFGKSRRGSRSRSSIVCICSSIIIRSS